LAERGRARVRRKPSIAAARSRRSRSARCKRRRAGCRAWRRLREVTQCDDQ
jgi:hypothetical protein